MPFQKVLFYIADDTFHIGSHVIHAGETVEAGHPWLKGRHKLFRPFTPTYPWKEPEAKPEPAPEPEQEKS